MHRRSFIRDWAVPAAGLALFRRAVAHGPDSSAILTSRRESRLGAGAGHSRSVHPAPAQAPRIDGARLNRRLTELSAFGRNEYGGITRVAFSEADVEARGYVLDLMRRAGLDTRIDAAGNIIGRREGADPSLAPLMTGSHIDSVPEGGNYDGQVGSMAAIEVAQSLADADARTDHPLEFVIFSNEENGKTGSKAMRGEDGANFLDLPTHSGRTVREGIRFIGGDPDRLAQARRAPGTIAGFVELHIEQGAVLETEGVDIGVVLGIVGIKRWTVNVTGFANHAGTTPMDQRRDALLAAARFVDAVHVITRDRPGRQVATVGSITAEPGAPNVIPGRATLSLEIRDLDMSVIDALFEQLADAANTIGQRTDTSFDFVQIYRTEPAATSTGMQDTIERAARGLGLQTMRMPSGAGHDAQEIARLAPVGMIFIPSRAGVSHSAEEWSAPEDITAGAEVLLRTLLMLDSESGPPLR